MNKNKIYQVAIIGCGRQNIEDHLPAVLKSKKVELDSFFDINEKIAKDLSTRYGKPYYTSLSKLLDERNFDIAIVAVPHNEYLPIIRVLAEHKIHILKEKPLAVSMAEAEEIRKIVSKNNIKMMVTLQRRFNPIYTAFTQLVGYIGDVYNIDARYTLNINRLDEGWRSKKAIAGGGALLDMGYHIVDLLVWYFGLPNKIMNIKGYSNRPNQIYDVEDSSKTLFEYEKNNKKIMGSMHISRIFPEKSEQLTVIGTEGIIYLKKGQIDRLDLDGNVVESLSRSGGWPSAAVEQLDYFVNLIDTDSSENPYLDHFRHQAFIEACYLSSQDLQSYNPSDLIKQI